MPATAYLASWSFPELVVTLGFMAVALTLDLAAIGSKTTSLLTHSLLSAPLQWLLVLQVTWLLQPAPEWVFVMLIAAMLPRLVTLLSDAARAAPDPALIHRKAVRIRRRMMRRRA